MELPQITQVNSSVSISLVGLISWGDLSLRRSPCRRFPRGPPTRATQEKRQKFHLTMNFEMPIYSRDIDVDRVRSNAQALGDILLAIAVEQKIQHVLHSPSQFVTAA